MDQSLHDIHLENAPRALPRTASESLRILLASILFLVSGWLANGQTIANSDFENGLSSWTVEGSFYSWTNSGRAHSGSRYAYFGVRADGSNVLNNGVGRAYQTVTIPPASQPTLSLWIWVTSDELPDGFYDHFYVEVLNTSDKWLATLADYSNKDKSGSTSSTTPAYSRKSFSLASYAGQTIRIQFRGTTDSATKTLFRLDDVGFALNLTSLTPTNIPTSTAPYTAILSAVGANFNKVNQIQFKWSGKASGSALWKSTDSTWATKVTVNSDTSMTLRPQVVESLPNWTGQADWTVTLTDTNNDTAFKPFTVTYTPPTRLSFTSLAPSAITTSTAPYDATLAAAGANFNNVTNVSFSWSGADTGSASWNRGSSSWTDRVTVNSDTSITLQPRVVETSPTWTGRLDWTVTLTDNSGATAFKPFTVTYTPPTRLSFTSLAPSAITTSTAPYDATLAAAGANFNKVNQIDFTWTGAASGKVTWKLGDSSWNTKVTVNSDTSITLQPRVVETSPTWSGTLDWTVTFTDNSGATAFQPFKVTYAPTTTSVELSGVPYIHQLYDTEDSFTAGPHACSVAATLMAIQFYHRLAPNPIVCTRNGTHNSDFGSYISRIYGYNGHIYNIRSSGVWGSADAGFYGGFGYFLQDDPGNSLQRSTRLREYISYHGLTSTIDEAVSGEADFTKICAEIDSGFPVVLLTSLTDDGHYVTCIGYVNGQHSLILNDPYGNKQLGYPNALGAGAKYDWPGYNNGNPNLKNVLRIIYARGDLLDKTPPTISRCSATSTTVALGQGAIINYTVSDTGGSHLQQVTLWRASIDGTPTDTSWMQIGNALVLTGDGPSSGSFPADAPSASGNYWYGIHVNDTANNYMDERLAGLGPIHVTVVPAEPISDLCDQAIVMSDGTTYTANTASATSVGDVAPSCGSGFGKGVWYKFTPTIAGPVSVSTCESDYDTILQVFTGPCGALLTVGGACNDDNGPVCSTTRASVTFNGLAGTTYFILAGGYKAGSGNLKIVATSGASTSFAGLVTDSSSGTPLVGASVQWGTATTITGSGGSYSFASVPCEAKTLTVSQAGYQTRTETYTPTCGLANTKNVLLSTGGTTVSNVRAAQTAGTKIVRIYYDISGTFAPTPVSTRISPDNGDHYSIPGPTDPAASPGNNRYLDWDAGVDFNNQHSTQMRVLVSAGSGSCPSPAFTIDTRDLIRPTVQDVSSKFFHGSAKNGQHVYFLSGVTSLTPIPSDIDPLRQRCTVSVAWNGKSPGTIHYVCPEPYDGLSTEQIFRVSSWRPGAKLTVIAEASDGTQSAPFVANFDIISPPPIVGQILYAPYTSTSDLQYQSADFDLDVFKGRKGVTKGVPIPGETMEIQPTVKAQARVDGSGLLSISASLGNDYEVKLNGTQKRRPDGKFGKSGTVEWDLAAQGSLEWQYNPGTATWELSKGYWGFYGTVDVNTPPYYIWATPPLYVQWQVGLDVFLGVNLLSILPSYELNSRFQFVSDKLPEFGCSLGCGVSGFLAAELHGSIAGKAEFSAPPLVWKKWGVGGKVTLQLVWLGHGSTAMDIFSGTSWIVGGTEGKSLAPAQSAGWQRAINLINKPDPSEFHPLSRHYLENSTPYSSFLTQKLVRPKFWGESISPGTPMSLQTNIYPYSEPALAVSGTNRLLLLITDNPDRSDENRTELVYSKWSGSSWSNPTSVWNDATSDFAPSVRVFPDGRAFAVWQNSRETLTNNAGLNAALSAQEICVGWYNPANCSWSCSNLTDNLTLDHSPQPAISANGKAFVSWIGNGSNTPTGSATEPNTIHSRLWTGAAWQDPGDVATNVGMLLWSTLAYDGTNGVFLATIDQDGDQSTINDQELYGATFDGTQWSLFSPLTANSLQDTRPQATYDSAGHLLVVWYQGTNLVSHTGNLSLSNATVAGLVGESSSAKDYRLITGPSGQITLLWESVAEDGSGPDPFMLNYDYDLAIWSQPMRLLSNTNLLERSFSGAYADNGTLLLAYNQAHIQTDTNGLPLLNSPVDLIFLAQPIGGDLAVLPGSLKLSTNNPLLGMTVEVSALVANWGETTATNVSVVFYNGPDRIGETQTLAVVSAGTTTNITVKWTIPLGTTNRTISLTIDPEMNSVDRNRANNTASIVALSPELAITGISVLSSAKDRRMMNATLVNIGGVGCNVPFQVSFRRGAADGPIIATVPVGSIPPGGHYDANVEWSLAGVTFTNSSELVYAIADPANLVPEADKSNNVYTVLVQINFDTDDDGIPDGWMIRYFGHATGLSADNSLAQDDKDGDGVNNLSEYFAGTDPTDSHSYLRMTSIISLGGTNGIQLAWGTPMNRLYTLQRASALITNGVSFTNIALHIRSTPPETTHIDTSATNSGPYFYRTIVEFPPEAQ